jgi:mRNA interferase RelE/StbE
MMDDLERPYDVQFTDTALKNLRRYPAPDQGRILASIEELAASAHTSPNVKRLVNFDVTYRLRVGNYRILFERDDIIRIIDVIDILSRERAYRRK